MYFICAFSTEACVSFSGYSLVHVKMKQPYGCGFVYTIFVTGQLQILQESDNQERVEGIEGVCIHLDGHALRHSGNVHGT